MGGRRRIDLLVPDVEGLARGGVVGHVGGLARATCDLRTHSKVIGEGAYAVCFLVVVLILIPIS
jgi:hypothetical protein